MVQLLDSMMPRIVNEFCVVEPLLCRHWVLLVSSLTSSLLESNGLAGTQRGSAEGRTKGRKAKQGEQMEEQLANKSEAMKSHLFSRHLCPKGIPGNRTEPLWKERWISPIWQRAACCQVSCSFPKVQGSWAPTLSHNFSRNVLREVEASWKISSIVTLGVSVQVAGDCWRYRALPTRSLQ